MSERATAGIGEVEDEEGEQSVEEEGSGETEVEDALANAPEVPQGSNLTPTNQPLVSQSDPVSSISWSEWLLLWDNFLKQHPPGTILKPLNSRLHQ
ncbi:hypothetical protein O181_093093 [Austropuccinia psidii MF-1]|uniref:Uncharacterized protein n=1 Tax=Austropuccinia psidii MF-1 TaxID=1389203 RepID=A0A9Q3J0K7_9BASI|nr:hypothetical protein [Austropuccinia psidii MF-1]